MKKLKIIVAIAVIGCSLMYSTNSFALRVWYDNGGDDYGCSGSGGTCLDDVVVTEPSLALQRALSAVELGNIAQIKTAFSNDRIELSSYFPGYLIDGVIHGTYEVSIKGDGGMGSTRYLKFYSTSGQLVNVAPFIL